ncbi:hypothetical protein MFFC18_43720 [Mariniblastus fucicola]|uniref:Uncharacterized protein n=1 Tax=Mariniblastus fucicola TaxID=980251 RepID=A0A5B9PIF0_9BACT|nr:hypothetical protein MFFC18_43720 [Mariniblastus fucicola]
MSHFDECRANELSMRCSQGCCGGDVVHYRRNGMNRDSLQFAKESAGAVFVVHVVSTARFDPDTFRSRIGAFP